MAQATYSSGYDDLEELRKNFEEFRGKYPTRTRFPEELWRAAAEMAKRRGVNPVCRSLRLAANSLKKWMGEAQAAQTGSKHATGKSGAIAPPAFMELIAPASAGPTNCTLEVEAPQGGKLRLEWRAVSATELAELIRAFVSR
jgi:transposase-like protein